MEFKDTIRSQGDLSFKEGEQPPNVNILFHGHTHNAYNLEGVTKIITDAGLFFEQFPGRNIIFLESSNFTPQIRGRMNSLIDREKYGVAGALLYTRLLRQLKRQPIRREVEEYAGKISEDGFKFDKVPREGYPDNDPQKYFLCQELDRLHQQYDFSLIFESHTPEAIRSERELNQISDNRESDSLDRMAAGDFSGALAMHKKALDALIAGLEGLRERETVNELSQLVKKSLRQKGNSSIFIIFGASHAPMMETLEHRFRKNDSVRYKTQLEGNEGLLDVEIFGKGRNKEIISDELYAQHLLANYIQVSFERDLSRRGLAFLFANNFEQIQLVIDRIARGLSVDEIRRIYEHKQSFLSLLRGNPLADSISSLIS